MPKKKKHFKLISSITIIFLGIILCSLWIYKPGLSDFKLKTLSFLPLPIATVGGSPVFGKNFLEAKSFFKDQPAISDSEIYSALLLNEKYASLLRELKTNPIYEYEKDSHDFLKKYAGIKRGLALYYNSSQSLNSKNYELANNLLARLKQGESFESLAKTYSQDPYSRAFGGLTGHSEQNSILPEVAKKAEALVINEPEIVPSSLGIHIIKKDGQNGALRQIFLFNEGFEAWLQASATEIKIKTFIKP